MKNRTIPFLLALVLAPLFAQGHGIIIIDHPHPIPRPRPPIPVPHRPIQQFMPLEVRSLQVESTLVGQKATTEFKQVFFNPSSRRLEGTFLFPLPRDAAIDQFQMEVNGVLTPAELLDAKSARKIYEDIVRKARDPALFEYAGQRLFKVRIFPIEPRKEKEVRLKYTQLLPRDGALVRYTCPLSTRKFSRRPVQNFALKVQVKAGKQQKLGTLYSPTHSVEINRKGKSAATLGLETKHLRAEGDFELFYSLKGQDGDPVDIQLLTHRLPGDAEGHYLLLLSPQAWDADRKPLPKDVLFVLDTSGSMRGDKIDQARKAMEFCIESLHEQDRFEIIRFSTEAEPLFDRLQPASDKNRKKALGFLKNLRAAGGTAIDEALRTALETVRNQKKTGARLTQVLFLTDGRPTIGETGEDAIVATVTSRLGKAKAQQPRIFNFGVGTDVNTHLLDKIAEKAGTFTEYVFPGEDLEHKVSTFYQKVSEPALAGLKLKTEGGVRLTKTYPRPLPDLFHGGQLAILGRYRAEVPAGTLLLQGHLGDQQKTFPFETTFPKVRKANAFIPRLWATRRVGYLLDEIRLHGDNKELREEVVALARKHGIVTPYTSYLIVEDEERRNLPAELSFSPASRNSTERNRLAQRFESFSDSKSGFDAVADAFSVGALKKSRELAAPPALAAPMPSRPAQGAASADPFLSGKSPAKAPGQPQARNLAGKTFYLNNGVWVDSAAQQFKDAQPIKVKFGTDAYFALLQQHPEAQQWLSVGNRCKVVIGGKLYEITD